MAKPTRYTYLVTIEQLPWSSERKPEFGSKEGWGKQLEKALSRSLVMAEVSEVKPTRTRNL